MSENVSLTIDGTAVSVPQGTLIIRAAEAVGIEVPRFCDHPLLDPVGACRTCMVEVEGQGKPVTSCTTQASDGMVVRTQNASEMAAKAQRGQLEFLLINHPLDCPVCDRGGECPLQDQTLAFGPAESRYIDPKRVYEKPVPLSPQVLLDRERCVLCARCTRFCDQISGERFIELFERGAAEQVSIAAGEDFASPFSGNTVQICPVGALTNASYRFAARPFDVESADAVCPHCACGCSIRVDVRRGAVARHLARDNPQVNEAWLCDKGRNAFRFPDRDRLETPLIRDGGLVPASFEEVLGAVARRAAGARVAFLGGGRLTDEDNHAMSRLARTALSTNDLDHRMASSEPPLELEAIAAAGLPVTYADVERARTIVVVGLDTREELPILHLRIRKAWRRHGARVFEVGPRRTPLSEIATRIPCLPGLEASAAERTANAAEGPHAQAEAALREAEGEALVLAGPRLAESDGAVAAWADVAARAGAGFALLPRRANDRGALRAGVHPALLPGGRRVEVPEERAAVETAWGPVPGTRGRGTGEILAACARREIDVLFLVGADPLADFPDAELADRALGNVGYRVVQDLTLGEYGIYADAVLPAAAFLEKSGAYTDWEGRSQPSTPVRGPVGLARPDWQIFQELSEALGADMGLDSLEAVRAEMGRLAAPAAADPLSAAAAATPSGGVAATPGPDGTEGLMVLFSYPLLVDDGRLSVDADELKRALHEDPFVEVHPDDARALGLADGERVRVRTDRGEAELPMRVSDGVVPGAAFVPFNQSGFRANALLSGRLRVPASLESALEPVGAGDE